MTKDIIGDIIAGIVGALVSVLLLVIGQAYFVNQGMIDSSFESYLILDWMVLIIVYTVSPIFVAYIVVTTRHN